MTSPCRFGYAQSSAASAAESCSRACRAAMTDPASIPARARHNVESISPRSATTQLHSRPEGLLMSRQPDQTTSLGATTSPSPHGRVDGQSRPAGDNAAMESFFSLLQKNVLNRRSWTTRDKLRVAIVTWIELPPPPDLPRTFLQSLRQRRSRTGPSSVATTTCTTWRKRDLSRDHRPSMYAVAMPRKRSSISFTSGSS